MAIVAKVCLALSAAAIPAVGLMMEMHDMSAKALCGGRRYETMAIPRGASPYVELSADGVPGPFLLDFGSTRSSLSAATFPAAEGSVRKASISLPIVEAGDFDLTRYDLMLQPGKPQLGTLGTDFLSRLSVQLTGGAAFLGGEACDPKALRAQGLTPVAQNGFFSSDLSKVDAGLPNVPVVYLRLGAVRAWAQIDTGYDDIVHPHSVDINEAMYERLVESGAKLERLADIDVRTCAGRESRRVYAVKGSALTIENDEARPIVRTDEFHLILKPSNACGGIADMSAPAAQLGASFLRLFGTIVFDPKSATVWIGGAGITEDK